MAPISSDCDVLPGHRTALNRLAAAAAAEWAAIAADGGPEFFSSYESYLRIDVAAGSAVGLGKWAALVESSLGSLVRRLERVPALELRPFPRACAAALSAPRHCPPPCAPAASFVFAL